MITFVYLCRYVNYMHEINIVNICISEYLIDKCILSLVGIGCVIVRRNGPLHFTIQKCADLLLPLSSQMFLQTPGSVVIR